MGAERPRQRGQPPAGGTGVVRVSLDGRFLGLPGIGRYVSGLWSALLEAGVDLVALAGPMAARGWLGPERYPPPGPAVRVAARPFWPRGQAVLPMVLSRHRAQVHHAVHLDVPYLTRVPVVLTVHDLFPLRAPANARSLGAAAYYRAAFPLAVRKAAALIAVSPFAAGELMEVLGVPEHRVHVVEPGVDRDRWRAPEPEVARAVVGELGVRSPYLLYVGTAKRHKNLATLLAALGPELPPLVLAGPTPSEVAALGLGPLPPGARALGRVADAALPSLYARARAVVLPSLYESVGFTALEAMACGTPVVSSDGGGLVHTVGDAGVLVPPLDVAAWRSALALVCADTDLRCRLRAAGRARAAERSWAASAQDHLDVYRAVAQ